MPNRSNSGGSGSNTMLYVGLFVVVFLIAVPIGVIYGWYSPSLKTTRDDLDLRLKNMKTSVDSIIKIDGNCIDTTSSIYTKLKTDSDTLNTDIKNFSDKTMVTTLSGDTKDLTDSINSILSKVKKVSCTDYCTSLSKKFDGSGCLEVSNATVDQKLAEANKLLASLNEYLTTPDNLI